MQKYLQKYNLVLYWSVVFLIIFIPLYFKFPLFGVGGTFVSIRLEDFFILVSLILWGGFIFISGKWKTLIHDKLFLAFGLFFLTGFVSLLSASLLTHTVIFKLGLLHWMRRIEFMMLFFLGYYSVENKKIISKLTGIFLLVLFIVNLYAIGQQYFHFPSISTTNSELSKGLIRYIQEGDRVNSTFAGHYDLAIFLMMSVIMILPYLIVSFEKIIRLRVGKNAILLLPVLGITLLSFIVLVMTAARLSFFALIFGIISVLVLIGRKRYLLIVLLLMAGVLIYPSRLRERLVSTFTVFFGRNSSSAYVGSEAQERRSQLNIPTLPSTGKFEPGRVIPDIVPGEPTNAVDLGVYRSLAIRTDVEWPRALRAFIKNPFLGTGYSSIGLATDNDQLRLLGEVGFLGFCSFILIITALVKKLHMVVKNTIGWSKQLAIGVFAMTIAFLVNSLLIDVFEASKVASLFWLINGVIIKSVEVD